MIDRLYAFFKKSSGICTDSRADCTDTVFFALKGDNFNGELFVEDALSKGAKYCVTTNQQYKKHPQCVVVEDTLKTLQQLAQYHRQKLRCTIIAITGTNGKTSTKELLLQVLQIHYKVAATEGNFNNHIGVPLTLLKLKAELDFGIVELGTNHMGEIPFLTRLVNPDVGIVTNIGKGHLEHLGSIENVAKEKTELLKYVMKKGGTIFVNADDSFLQQYVKHESAISYGIEKKNVHITASLSANKGYFLNYTLPSGRNVQTQLFGAYNLYNCLVAHAVGTQYNIPEDVISQAIENYSPSLSRSQLENTGSNQLILECYNANPTSMMEALRALHSLKIEGKLKMCILGDMEEVGEHSEKEHQEIVKYLSSISNLKEIILVGKKFAQVSSSETTHFLTTQEAADYLQKTQVKNRIILMKGSRSNQLEQLKKYL